MEALINELELNRDKAYLVEPRVIGLPKRALNLVLSKNIENSYDAIRFILYELASESGVGPKTVNESALASKEFVEKINSLSLELVKSLNDPRETFFAASDGNIVECFPALVTLYSEKGIKNSDNRMLDILVKRFGLMDSKQYTLEEIGTFYDVTRERIRQVEAKGIKELKGILKGEIQPKKWKICEKLVDNFNAFESEISEYSPIISEEVVKSTLSRNFGSSLDVSYLSLLLEVLGYRKVPTAVPGFRGTIKDSWCSQDNYSKEEIELMFMALNSVFDYTEGLSTFDVIILAKKFSKKRVNKSIENDSLEVALQSVLEFEKVSDIVRVKISYLRSAADKAFRVLDSVKQPMHYSKLCREINLLSSTNDKAYAPVSETNVTNQLTADDRFIPVGKSGFWGLSSSSDIENITIVQALERILHRTGKPMEYADILSELKEIRPYASEKSVVTYLNDDSKFARVGRRLFALNSWRIKPSPKVKRLKSISSHDFALAVKEGLQIENPQPFATLISIVAKSLGCSEVSARQKLRSLEAIELRDRESGRGKEVFCPDLSLLDELIKNVETKKVLLKDLVQNEVKSILYARPNEPILKGDLYHMVISNVSCLRPTFYQYLEKMDSIEQYSDNGKHYAVYKHYEPDISIKIDPSQYGANDEVKNKLARPLGHLTISNVDIALGELGLIFENSLRDYLNIRREKDPSQVSSKELNNLVSMITCAVKLRVVTKGYHLNTLREERNNRAHGEVLDIHEKKKLFDRAHYLAELFVKYICFFELKKQSENVV
ncbi:sigma factor-like helix-turn-helix DNA-binding protein [Cobetia sp. AM6]|uniref:sigma factor-like helix-turn-helix DNA-binding protein n=1 Tax=Cobetia sp. AM6 TaxID=2661553 RepID=UPI00129940BA|nr:sigma factor-like helix-turn-helix DNA-binding protein [Cobetia sp. AM6]BBO56582.1 hypothetical protein CLAM6_18930 [Cobetia sp. AM6]